MDSRFGFGRHTWVRKGSKFSFSGFGPGFGPFLAEQVLSLGFLEGFGWIRGSALVDRPGFRRVLSSVFLDLGLGSAHFWLNRFKVRDFRKGFEWVRSSFLVVKLMFEQVRISTFQVV